MNGLPAPYPDEFWYSIVARRLRDWGYMDRQAELRQAFGSWAPKICMASPLRPGKFFENVRATEMSTTLMLVLRHTLLPCYLAFAPPAKRIATLAVIEGSGGFDKLRMGAVTRKLAPAFLRFCSECLEVDEFLVGESYWHRSHQLWGFDRCPMHGGVLYESSIPFQPGRLDYWTAHPIRCRATPATRVVAPMSRVLSGAIAQIFRLLFGSGEIADLWIDKRRYAELLVACGYAAPDGRVAATDFERGFQIFLRQRRADIGKFGPTGWWRVAFTGVPGTLAPLQHLLLREFIRHRLIRNGHRSVPIDVVDAHFQFCS